MSAGIYRFLSSGLHMVLWPQETLDLLIELLGSGSNPHESNGGPCAA